MIDTCRKLDEELLDTPKISPLSPLLHSCKFEREFRVFRWRYLLGNGRIISTFDGIPPTLPQSQAWFLCVGDIPPFQIEYPHHFHVIFSSIYTQVLSLLKHFRLMLKLHSN